MDYDHNLYKLAQEKFVFSGHGFWSVGNNFVTTNKVEAIQEANRRNLHIEWNFNQDILDKVDWFQEPQVDLYELYKQRALQIREKFDYLVLLFSGGSDSVCILKTFLENNIPLEEIHTTGWLDKHVDMNHVHNAEMQFSKTGMPLVKEAQSKGYNFVFYNFYEDFKHANENINEEWFLNADNRLCIDDPVKEPWWTGKPWQHLIDKGVKVGLIVGYEKPRVFIKDGYFTIGFLDNNPNNVYRRMYQRNVWTGIRQEWFFRSPDMPQLIQKSIHMIANYYLELYKDRLEILPLVLTHTAGFNTDNYYKIINDVLYDRYWNSKEAFNLGKPNGNLFGPKWKFMHEHYKESNYYKTLVGARNELFRDIGSKWINSTNDLGGNWSKMYPFKRFDIK